MAAENYQQLQISRRGMATGQRLVVSIEGKQEVGLAESCCCVKVSLGANVGQCLDWADKLNCIHFDF